MTQQAQSPASKPREQSQSNRCFIILDLTAVVMSGGLVVVNFKLPCCGW